MSCTTKGKFILSIIQNKVTLDKKANLLNAKRLLEASIAKDKPDILVLPEFFNTPLITGGNPTPYAEYKEDSETLSMLSNVAKANNVYLIGGSIPIKDKLHEGKLFNTSFSFDNKGEIKAIYRKMHLFDVEIPGKVKYKESDRITPGGKDDLFTVFETPFARFGIGICYDIRFYEHPHLLKAKYNIDCMVYPSAFSKPTGEMHWDLLRRMRALDNNVHIIMASPSRNYEDESYFQVYGHSSVINPYGQVIKEAGIDEEIITCEIDLNRNKEISEQIPTWKHKRKDLYEIISKI